MDKNAMEKEQKSLIRKLLLVLVTAAFLGAACYFNKPRNVRMDPLMLPAFSAMGQINTELRIYAYRHRTFPDGEQRAKSWDSLVSQGVLSPEDAIRIRKYRIQFHGFDLGRIQSSDDVFMDAVFTNTDRPCRIVVYNDGSQITAPILPVQ